MGSGQVLWTSTGRNKILPPSTSLPVMGEIASVRTASLGGCLHSSKTIARRAKWFHGELNGHVFDLERDGFGQVCTLPLTHQVIKTSNHTVPDRTPPGSTTAVPSAVHQNRGVKNATGASSKIRGRDNITIGTWNTRTLTAAGDLQELTHEMDRYRWNILGLREVKWQQAHHHPPEGSPFQHHSSTSIRPDVILQ